MIKIGTRKDDLYLIIIILFTLILFFPILDNYFLLDDTNWMIRGINFQKNPLSLFKETEDGFLRPVLILLFGIVYPVFKLKATYYYALNLFIHILNSLLVYLIISKLSKNKEITFLSSLFFAISFSHYQAVIWIAAIPHLLSAFFFFLSLILYINAQEKKSIYLVIISLFCYYAGVLSRETVILLPIIIFFMNNLIFKRHFIENLKSISPYLLLVLSHILLYQYYLNIHILPSVGNFFLTKKFLYTLSSCLLEMILNLFGIINLPFYSENIFSVIGAINLLTIIFFIIIILICKDKYPFSVNLILLGFLSSILVLIPITSTTISPYSMFHRFRYFYIPSFGISLCLAYIIYFLYENFKKKILGKFVILLIISIIILNCFAIYKVEKYYDYYGEITRTILNKIVQTCEEGNIYLINFPDKPFLVFGSKKHIENLVNLFFKNKIKIFWYKGDKSLIIKKEEGKNYFLEFKNGRIEKLQ